MVAEALIAYITVRIGASERGRIVLDSCRGDRCVGCGKLAMALYLVFAILACALQRVRSSMEVQRIAQMEEHMNTARQAIRDAWFRAQAAENRSRAAETATPAAGAPGARQGTVPTALVDTRLLGKPRPFSGALAGWKSSRAGTLSPEMKRAMERAVAADRW